MIATPVIVAPDPTKKGVVPIAVAEAGIGVVPVNVVTEDAIGVVPVAVAGDPTKKGVVAVVLISGEL